MDYIEIAQRNPRNRHQIIRTQDLRKYINKAIINKQELYSSYYFYDKEILEHMRTFKTVRSFEGKRYIETLKFDYDKGLKTNEELLVALKYFIDILIKDWNVDKYEEMIIWYSGRGYHIEIPNIFRFEPSQYLPDEWTKTAKKYFPEVDTMPFNKVGLFRVPQTVNAKTNLFKVGFTVDEIYSYAVSRILQEAEKPQEKNWTIDLETHLDYSEKIVRQEHKRKEDSKRGEPTQVITCMQNLYNRGSVKGRRHKDMLRMISAWRRAGVPQELLIVAMKDWVEGDMTDYEVKKNVTDTYNRKYEYGCKDEVMAEFCDPKCRFYKQKNYAVELITSQTAESQFVEFMKMDFKNVAFDLNEVFPMERSFMFFPGEFVMLIGNTKIGKGIRLDEVLPTPNGWKEAGKIETGDELYGANGKPVKVTYISQIHNRDNYKVIFNDGSYLITDDQHLWTVNRRYINPQNRSEALREDLTISTKELYDKGVMTTYRSKFRVKMNKAVEYNEKVLLVDPYLLGCWLGDGDKNSGRLTSSFEDLKHYRKYFNIKSFCKDKRNNSVQFSVKGLVTQLREYGILGAKKIPDVYLCGSIEQRIELLKGLMDTDGCAEMMNVFYNTNGNIINGICELLSSLGIKYSVKTKRAMLNGKEYKLCYRVTFRSLFAPFKLKRKINKTKLAIEGERANWRYIRKIKKVKSKPTICFKVDAPDELFLAGKDYIVTHNTAVAQNIAIKLKKFPIDYYSLEVGNRLLFRRAVQIEHGYSKEQVMRHYQNNTNTLSQGLEHISMSVISPDLDQLKRKIAERQPKLVIIDPIDGLSVGRLGEFRTREEKLGITLGQMAKDLDTIIFGIHHIPKSAVKDQYGKIKPLDVHSGKGDSALEQKADKVLGFEGEANKTSRILRSLAARDEDPFALSLHYNKRTFRLTKIKELSLK